ncbi:MAG: outer membrane protein assembly factor BamA [Thermodesulfobacteriota bacterium]
MTNYIQPNSKTLFQGSLIILFFLLFIQNGLTQEIVPNIVEKIIVSGNSRIGTDAILAKIKSKEKQPFSSELVREDIRSIYKMGFFEDVNVDIADTATGKKLTFTVKETPFVKKINITGNKKLEEKTIKEVIKHKTNTFLKKVIVKEDIERIRKLYISKGYYLAVVESSIGEHKTGVAINFKIEEGKKVKLKKIIFTGNEAFKNKRLKKVIDTKEAGWFSFITGSGVFNEDMFENDINRLLAWYFDHGYIQVEIGRPDIKLSDDKKGLFITVPVKEGEQYKVGQVEFEGDILTAEKDLSDGLKTVQGKVFSRKILGEDISRLTDIYADKGYAFIDIAPLTRLHPDRREVDITFNLKKGNKVFVERIDISGNTKTRDKVIRRELELREGDLFSSTGLRRSRRNLNRLGFFDDIGLSTERGSGSDKIKLNLEVKERSTGNFSAGAGYSSVDNMIANASISENNLFGTGRKLKADVTISGSSKRYELSFTEPWFMDRPISAGFDIFKVKREYSDFTRFSNGGDIRFGFPVYQDTRLFLTYKLEEVEVTDVADNAAKIITDQEQEGKRLESSLTTVVKRDTRNSLLDPTDGSVVSFSIELAGGPLGGDNNFTKYFLSTGRYFPMPFNTSLLLRGRIGFIDGFGGKKVPIYERFFVGGMNTVRGFEARSLGPKDDTTEDVIGGDKELIFNVEYIFPIIAEQRVKGVIFFDAGNAYNTGEGIDLNKLRIGAGAGIRWLSPIGPLRLEWGFNLNRKEGEKDGQFEFSIGGSF